MNRAKIQAKHLARDAYVYVRQSTRHQVEHHLESQQRQYELTVHATDLGWQETQVIVIDDDLGSSASGRTKRTGFERLVSDVALGRAGIVLGLEVSRLARNNRDWYGLLDLCAMKGTLIGDADNVYDASAYDDRLVLGMKGTMSEAELHLIMNRMLNGLRHKAEKGTLRFLLPPGYEFDDDQIVKTNDEQVVQFIELVFAKMLEHQSVSAVHKDLVHDGLRFPRRERANDSIRWETPYYRAVYKMLVNPIYAGTYAWGRTETVTDVDLDGTCKTRRRDKPVAEWAVVLHDHHPGYVSWADFERIQVMIERNRPAVPTEASLALREGAALLQGLVRCGRCGRSMTVRYQSGANKPVSPIYCCIAAHAQHRGEVCQSMGGKRIEAAVARAFLDAMSETQLEVELAALDILKNERDAVLRQLELQVERARYEAGRIERQYNAVEPENRVVARTLEARWNEALAHVDDLERRLAQRRQQVAAHLTSGEACELRRLSKDLSALWAHKSVTNKDRKALLRSVIEEVQLDKKQPTVDVKILWKGGEVSELSVSLIQPQTGPKTPVDLVRLVRELATRHTDAEIARILIRRRFKTTRGKTFTARHVADLRRIHGIAVCPSRDGASLGAATTYTVEQAARLFEVSAPTIYSWLKLGVLVGEQVAPGAPWSIPITDADRRRLSQEPPHGWVTVDEATAELGVSKQTILNWVKAHEIPYAYASHGRRRGLRIDVNSAPRRKQGRLVD